MLSFASGRSPTHGRLKSQGGGLVASRSEKPTKDVSDTVVCFDHLMGIKCTDSRYTFVQYTPTMCHKAQSGIKRDTVDQVNSFLRSLRQHNVPHETALFSTYSPSIAKELKIKIPLGELQELSLELLWNVQGHANLDSQQQWVIVFIGDPEINSCVFNEKYELEVDLSGSKNKALRDVAMAALGPADASNPGSVEGNRQDLNVLDRIRELDKRSCRRDPVLAKATGSSVALRLRKGKSENKPSAQESERTQGSRRMLRTKPFITRGRYVCKKKNALVRSLTFSDDDCREKVSGAKQSPSSAVEGKPGAPTTMLQQEKTDQITALSCDMIKVLPESANESVLPDHPVHANGLCDQNAAAGRFEVDLASAPRGQWKRNCRVM